MKLELLKSSLQTNIARRASKSFCQMIDEIATEVIESKIKIVKTRQILGKPTRLYLAYNDKDYEYIEVSIVCFGVTQKDHEILNHKDGELSIIADCDVSHINFVLSMQKADFSEGRKGGYKQVNCFFNNFKEANKQNILKRLEELLNKRYLEFSDIDNKL